MLSVFWGNHDMEKGKENPFLKLPGNGLFLPDRTSWQVGVPGDWNMQDLEEILLLHPPLAHSNT